MNIRAYKFRSFAIITFLTINCFTLKAENNLGHINCRVKNKESVGFWVSATLKGKISEAEDKKTYTLKNTSIDYKIFAENPNNLGEKAYVWYEQKLTKLNITSDPSYRPRRYHGYIKFALNKTHQIPGKISILINTQSLNNEKVNMQLIFTNIIDHWGGSVSLFCSIK